MKTTGSLLVSLVCAALISAAPFERHLRADSKANHTNTKVTNLLPANFSSHQSGAVYCTSTVSYPSC